MIPMSQSGSLRIGYLSTVYHTAFLLRGSDILKDQDITAAWTLFPSGPDIVASMQAGNLDLAYIGLPPVIIGIDRGIPLACIAGGHVEGTVMVAGGGIRSLHECASRGEFLAQFKGAAIGTPPRGSIHDVIVRDLLSAYQGSGIQVVNYPWADFLPAALEDGEIAAAAGTPALAIAAERYGKARLVVPPDQLWPWNPSYGIVVMRNLLANEDLLERFLRAHEAASQWIRQDPAGCARVVAGTTGFIDAPFAEAAYRISPKYCASLPPEYLASTERFAEKLFSLGYTKRKISAGELFSPNLINRIHKEPEHYSAGFSQA
ncbi:MAG: ABC transporter substrate-binding protein [Methanoregulaceae archaeon]